jgi:DNA (cytosine-5)-methyltransferase 1
VRILNLYAGLGGNRKNWQDCQITAVELEPKIAAVYQRLHPQDTVIVGDAHAYLVEHFEEFDFIWTSPPCQSHSRMSKATRHKSARRYLDMSLYQEIVFLRAYFKGRWCVENVVPYYEPLVAPTVRMGRHLFWTNFAVTPIEVPTPPNFINRCNLAGKAALMDWLGIHYPENIYYGKNHCPAQILRNCVHPTMGAHVFNAAKAHPLELALTG